MTFYVHVLHALNWVEMPVRPSCPPPHWKCCVIVGGSIVTYLWIIRPSLCPEEGIVHCFWCTSLTKCENLLCGDSPHSCAKILRTAVRRFFAQLCEDSLHSSLSQPNLKDEPNLRSEGSLFHQSDAVMSFCVPHFQNLKTWCVKVFHTTVRRFSAQLCEDSPHSCARSLCSAVCPSQSRKMNLIWDWLWVYLICLI